MKRKYHGKIFYTMDKEHPDIKYVDNWTEDMEFSFEDVYSFDMDYTHDEIVSYIKHDLSLVAGGGYNTDHIHNVMFNIRGE